MKLSFVPLVAAAVAAIFTLSTAEASLAPYAGDYSGTVGLKTGKKSRQVPGMAQVVTSMVGDSGVFTVSAAGPKGQGVQLVITLNADGTGSLLLDGKLIADPKMIKEGDPKPRGGKVRVKIKAAGTYTGGTDGSPIVLAFSGNKGKSGGNVTGTLSLDGSGGLVLGLNSGFKQVVPGLGRRIGVSFAGQRLIQ
jgi:hypothetical protein